MLFINRNLGGDIDAVGLLQVDRHITFFPSKFKCTIYIVAIAFFVVVAGADAVAAVFPNVCAIACIRTYKLWVIDFKTGVNKSAIWAYKL